MFKIALLKGLGWRIGSIIVDAILGIIMKLRQKYSKKSTEEYNSKIFRHNNLTIAVTCINCA